MAERSQVLSNLRGAAAGWILVGLIAVAVGVLAATRLLPRTPAPEPAAAVARGKIPPMPAEPPDAPAVTPQPLETDDRPVIATPFEQESPTSVIDDQTEAAPPDITAPAGQMDSGHTAAGTDEPSAALSDSPLPEAVAIKHKNDEANPATSDVKGATDTSRATISTTVSAADGPLSETDDPPVADVTVEDGRIAPAASESEPPEITSDENAPFSIQIGAFRTETYAQKLAKTVEALGYPTYIHTVGKNGQPPLYQVRFGRFATLDAATQSAGNFRQKENRSAVVVKVPASQKD